MKLSLRIFIAIIILFVLSITLYFIYTRFCLPKYKTNGNTLTYKNYVYVVQDFRSAIDEENLDKTIGVGVGEKRTLTDLIWPFWVIEYKNDKEDNSLFLSGLMGSGGKYNKVSK